VNTRKVEGEFKIAFLIFAFGVTLLGAFLAACGHPASAIGFPMTVIGGAALVAHGLYKWSEWRWWRRTQR
jgi:hypothetical protein